MASIEELLKANIEALNKNTAAVEKLAEAGLGNVDAGAKTSKAPAKKSAAKKVEEEPEEDEGMLYFYRKSNGQLWETEDAKEIAKLRKTKGVQELDEEEYNELLEKREEELTGKKKQAAKKVSKSKAKEEEPEDDEDDDLDDLDEDEDEDDEEEEFDLKDAQKILKQVKEEVGAAAVKKIFKKLGVAKFPEIKEEDATKAVKLAQAELDE